MKFNQSGEQYMFAVESQRAFAIEQADKIEQGEKVDDRQLVAAMLRTYAALLPKEQPKPVGQARKIDATNVALEFVLLTRIHGVKPTPAKAHLAEKFDVSIRSISNALARRDSENGMTYLEQALYYVEQFDPARLQITAAQAKAIRKLKK